MQGVRVLIVEYNLNDIGRVVKAVHSVAPEAVFVTAWTQPEARRLLHEQGPFSLIIMNGWLPDPDNRDHRLSDWERALTRGLIYELRRMGYTGPMIACTRNYNVLESMISAGCTHGVYKPHLEQKLGPMVQQLLLEIVKSVQVGLEGGSADGVPA